MNNFENMATVRQLYDTEIKGDYIGPEGPFPLELNGNALSKPILWKMLQSNTSRSTIFTFYIPDNIDPLQIAISILDNSEWVLKLKIGLIIKSRLPGHDEVDLSDTVFTGRFILYIENRLRKIDFETLLLKAKSKEISLIIRDLDYLEKVVARNFPLAFISHDSRDKAEIAGELARLLIQNLCPVWYDEYSLSPGDNLRESIEKGIKECKKCILILTPNFLSNNGWTKKEFDSIFTRELVENNKLIIPIWAGVSKKEIFDYSPSLANTVGIKWDIGIQEVTRKIMKVLL